MECGICFENMEKEEHYPYRFPCKHTFCKKCVQQLTMRGELREINDNQFQSNWKCPNCRSETIDSKFIGNRPEPDHIIRAVEERVRALEGLFSAVVESETHRARVAEDRAHEEEVLRRGGAGVHVGARAWACLCMCARAQAESSARMLSHACEWRSTSP